MSMTNIHKAVLKRGFTDAVAEVIANRCARAFDAENTPDQEEFIGEVMFDVVVDQELNTPKLPALAGGLSPGFVNQKNRVVTERRKQVVRMRGVGLTLEKIAQVLGVTRETVRSDWRIMEAEGKTGGQA